MQLFLTPFSISRIVQACVTQLSQLVTRVTEYDALEDSPLTANFGRLAESLIESVMAR